MKQLSVKQLELINRLKGGNLLIYSNYGCYIEAPYSEEDGRTVGSLIDRKLLKFEGNEKWPSTSQMWTLIE